MKVIWFDDQEKSLLWIHEQAQLNDIDLVGFTDAETGIQELEKKIEKYDAAIVDGKFWRKKGLSTDEVVDSALIDVARTLERLQDRKKLPWFVLSGQTTFTREKNSIVESYKEGKVYDKLSAEDLQSLWSDIRKEYEKQEEIQIRHLYAPAFEIFNRGYLPTKESEPLIEILKSLNHPEDNFNDELYFTRIRIILEALFRAANRFGLLHDKCISNGIVNLNESSLFLSGLPTKYLGVISRKPHFDKIISDAVRSIIGITGAASHTSEENDNQKYNIDLYREYVRTPYLLYGLTFRLMDVLVWFSSYVEKNPDIEINQSYWADLDDDMNGSAWVAGVICEMNLDKGHAFLKINESSQKAVIPKELVVKHNLNMNLNVLVVLENYVHTKSGTTKQRAVKLRIRE